MTGDHIAWYQRSQDLTVFSKLLELWNLINDFILSQCRLVGT